MTTATLGCVDEFDSTKDDWPQYVERLANGIDNAEKKQAILLTAVGAATYKTQRNIVSPSKPGEKSYAQATYVFKNSMRVKRVKPRPSTFSTPTQLFSHHRMGGLGPRLEVL